MVRATAIRRYPTLTNLSERPSGQRKPSLTPDSGPNHSDLPTRHSSAARVPVGRMANQDCSDSGIHVFWVLSVNGTLSPAGIDGADVNDGDSVEWNHQSFEPAQHAAVTSRFRTS
jgi:hypothetical protein